MQKVSYFSFCTAKKEKKIFLKADFDVETKCGTELLAVGRWGWITWCVTVSSAPSLPVRRRDIAFCVCVCTHTRLAWEKATSTECLCLTCSVSPLCASEAWTLPDGPLLCVWWNVNSDSVCGCGRRSTTANHSVPLPTVRVTCASTAPHQCVQLPCLKKKNMLCTWASTVGLCVIFGSLHLRAVQVCPLLFYISLSHHSSLTLTLHHSQQSVVLDLRPLLWNAVIMTSTLLQ